MEFEGAGSPFSATCQREAQPKLNTGNVQLTPSLSVNMQRTTLAKLVKLDPGRVSLLDNVAVTYSSQMENSIEAPDSVFGALDVASMKLQRIEAQSESFFQFKFRFCVHCAEFQLQPIRFV